MLEFVFSIGIRTPKASFDSILKKLEFGSKLIVRIDIIWQLIETEWWWNRITHGFHLWTGVVDLQLKMAVGRSNVELLSGGKKRRKQPSGPPVVFDDKLRA